MGLFNKLAAWREYRGGVKHSTFNPDGPGVVRIHLIPPKFRLFGSLNYIVVLNGYYLLPLGYSLATMLSAFMDEANAYDGCEIGMANEYFTVLDGHSANIRKIKRNVDADGYCSTQIYFDRSYGAGTSFEFYFTVNQRCILAADGESLLYEFVPGWFNYVQVGHYFFNLPSVSTSQTTFSRFIT